MLAGYDLFWGNAKICIYIVCSSCNIWSWAWMDMTHVLQYMYSFNLSHWQRAFAGKIKSPQTTSVNQTNPLVSLHFCYFFSKLESVKYSLTAIIYFLISDEKGFRKYGKIFFRIFYFMTHCFWICLTVLFDRVPMAFNRPRTTRAVAPQTQVVWNFRLFFILSLNFFW